MNRHVVCAALMAMLASTGPARSEPAKAAPSIIVVKDHDELNKAWCAADPNMEHFIVLPASLFVDSKQVNCGGQVYKLYRIIEDDDPDDFEYFLDPPFGHTTRLGCDGKAGRTMQTVAINCRPLSGN